MNRYEISTPRTRTLFGMAAVAMTAITIGIAVVLPAEMRHVDEGAAPLATAAAPAPIEVVISPARIDVIGERNRQTAFEPVGEVAPKRAQES
jgi:hypothetical protein